MLRGRWVPSYLRLLPVTTPYFRARCRPANISAWKIDSLLSCRQVHILSCVAGIDRGPCRIIELLGADRPGLLADITKTLSHSACDAWSASIWTNLNRATFVLGVNDARFPLHDPTNWRTLRSRLQHVMGGPTAHTIVQLSSVVRMSLYLQLSESQQCQ